ncbi:MAG TPA: outer membrane beta-barrel protein, partial [Gemmataceae bacterium]
GRFFAQFGYESIDSTQTPFVSRSYNFIYDPFTHTGVLTTLKLTDAWSVQNGVVTGCDVFFGPAVNPCYVGSVKWAPPTGRNSVLFSYILGSGRFDQKENFHNPEIFDVVYTHKFSDRFSYALDALYGLTWNVPDIGFANWWATGHYLSYVLTPRLTAQSRLELFDDIQGQRTGFAGLYIAPTIGVVFKPIKDILIRPELRYDYNTESRPFENKHGVFTATTDLLVRW